MAQWYAQLVFKDDRLLGEGLTDFAEVEGIGPLDGGEPYTTVIVSGYALYGQLRGYYALGVAHLAVDPATGVARYVSEESARHTAPVSTLSPAQRQAVHDWLVQLNAAAWQNSTDGFKRDLEEPEETRLRPGRVP